MGARRIVFDAIDIVLALLPDDAARRREAYLPRQMDCPGVWNTRDFARNFCR